MNNGQNTNSRGSFRTRFHITPVDSCTGLPTASTTTIDNMVLASGYLSLGDPTAYRSLSIGTNPLPASPHQTGILTPIAQQNISEAQFSQHISDAVGIVFSTCSFEFLFKDFLFPANLKTIDLTEIGLDGLTRAVFGTVQITRNNWVSVIMEVIYEYSPTQAEYVIDYNNYDPGVMGNGALKIQTTAIIYNTKPNNNNGRGWGTDRSVVCYPWSGTEGDYTDRNLTNSLGMSITPKLMRDQYQWQFGVKVPRTSAPVTIHGLIIRDTVNGGGFLLHFSEGEGNFILPEDGTLDLQFNFNWNPPQSNL